MSNITLKTAVRVNGWANTAVRCIQKRYENKDRGQTAFEYLGIILVVVAIIGAIVATGIGGDDQHEDHGPGEHRSRPE